MAVIELPKIATDEELELFSKVVSDNVKRLRIEKNISQLDMALSIGQKGSGFYACAEAYLNAKRFNIFHLYKIAKVLECDICEFFKPIDIPTQSGS